MECFTEVTSRFYPSITHLVFDDTQPGEYALDDWASLMGWAITKPTGSNITFTEARNACCRIFHSSKDILDSGEDLKVL